MSIVATPHDTEVVKSGEVSLPPKPREWFKFYTPGECKDYEPPPGFVLVGDCHLVRGSVYFLLFFYLFFPLKYLSSLQLQT